ncbi:MAG: choice-of-anchor L domain-containing protein [Candidatus Acidiferrales bacterium]
MSAHHRAQRAAQTQAARPRKVRVKAVQLQQGLTPPLLVVPTFAADKQGLDGGGPAYLIPVLNSSTTTSVQITSVTADPSLTVTSNCSTLAPGASCTISMTFVTQSLLCSASVTGNITIANSDTSNPSLVISVTGFGGDEDFQIKNLTDTTLNPGLLAGQLVGTGVTISNVKYTGSPVAAGTFHSESSIVGFTDGIILSTGSVRSVIGPNCSSEITTASGYPGDTDLSNLIGQNATFDAAVLEFDFVPTNPTIRFQYVFSSDEYEEFVFQYNDVFGFFVNGQNVALIPQTSTPVSINNVNNGSTQVFGIPPVNPQFYVNNDIQIFATPPVDTEMDGLTVVLAATSKVNPGATNHIKLAIADALDDVVDSNVFIKAGSLSSSVVSLSPTGLAFGNLNVGSTSSTQTISLTNVGTAALTGVTIAPDSSNFTVSNNTCGANVAVGATCTFAVAFTPQAQSLGLIQGQINIADNAGDSPQPVTLSGTAVNGPFASISPLNLFFAPEAAGATSPPQTVTVTNTGTAPLTFGSVSNTNTDFKLTNGCTASVPVNGTCTIMVTWTAPAAGTTLPETDSITLQNNGQNGGTQSVGLVGGATSTITVAPMALTFGNQPVNTTSAAQTVTIMNTGSVPVAIPSIVAPAGFAETDNCVSSGGLIAGASCMIMVTFAPTSVGPFSGSLMITDSAQGSPHTVMLTGTGTAAAPTLVSIAVTPATATIGINATQQFTATGTFSDNSTKDVTTQSAWTSSNTATATVGAATGLATGVAGGTVAITATDGTIKGTAQLTVSSGPTLKSIAVTPSMANIAVNGTQQFTATGTFSDNSTKDVTTQSAWKSSNTEVATVGAGTGLATGVGVGGPVTITATDAGISGTAQLTVSNVPFSLTINPPPGGVFGPVAPGGTLPVGVILTALPGTTGTVTFGCTTSSPTITCSPKPSSVALLPNGPLQVAIVVNTFCKGPTTGGNAVPGGLGGGIGLLLQSTMLAGTAWRYRRNPRWAVSFALFVLIALGGVACNSLPRNPNGVTLPGNYQLFITATFNGQTVSAPAVNFVVN